jgi:hypothetical protein
VPITALAAIFFFVVTKAQIQPFYSVGFKDAETPAPGVVSMVASRLKVSG